MGAGKRTVLKRKIINLQTPYGQLDVKQVILPDGTTRNYPEYESIASICKEKNLNYMEVCKNIQKYL